MNFPNLMMPVLFDSQKPDGGDVKAIQLLLEMGLDSFGENPKWGHTTPDRKRKEVMEVLLTVVVPQLRAQNSDGSAPLHYAAAQEHPDIIEILLSVATELQIALDINQLDNQGTPRSRLH